MSRVAIQPNVIRWARKRGQVSVEALAKRFPKLRAWENGESLPTLKQLENFAKVVRVPLGYLLLPKPPTESLPIPDFRTISGTPQAQPSPELLDTVYAMQRRQAWLRETLLESDTAPLEFVGSARLTDAPKSVGREMRRVVGLDSHWASNVSTWREAATSLRQAIEDLGVIAVVNGVVGNNTHRQLDVAEFRGFALCDDYAPLIFVNGADAKSAQMFTLAHEFAHIWLGSGGVSGFAGIRAEGTEIELFCDQAAAEFLVAEEELRSRWNEIKRTHGPFDALARHFKVSPIVVGRRALDLDLIDRDEFFAFYRSYAKKERERARATGGDFYNNQNARVGKLFAVHVISAAIEGRIGFKRAYDLTDLRGGAFQEYAERLGFEL